MTQGVNKRTTLLNEIGITHLVLFILILVKQFEATLMNYSSVTKKSLHALFTAVGVTHTNSGEANLGYTHKLVLPKRSLYRFLNIVFFAPIERRWKVGAPGFA